MPNFHVYDLFEVPSLIQVVDVGAAPNSSSPEPYQFLINQGVARVIGFEPDERACSDLNSQFDGTQNQCFPYFVGDGTERTFHTLSSPLCSSLYPPNRAVIDMFTGLEDYFNEVRRDTVSTTRLDDIPELGSVDFLKLDVQGAELDVLKGGVKTLEDTMIVLSEVEFVELYEEQPLFGDISSFMRDHGFMFHAIVGGAYRAFKPMIIHNDPNQGLKQMLWADVLFFRDPRLFRDYSTEKLLKFAIVMHELMESYDVVLTVLNIIDEREGSSLSAAYLGRF